MESASSDVLPRPGRRRKLKVLLRVALVLIVPLITVVLLAPTVLSTGIGKGFVEDIVGKDLSGSLEIGSLSLAWFGGQSIQDVRLQDADGNTVELKEVSTELTLWKALLGNYDLGKTRLRNLDVTIVVRDSGARDSASGEATSPAAEEEADTAGAKGKPSEAAPLQNLLPQSLLVDAEVTAARISVATPQKLPVVIDNLEFFLTRAAPGDPLAFRFSGHSRQGELAGSFSGKGELHGLLGGGEEGAPRAQVQIAVKDLPTDGVDALLGLHGVLSAGLGPMINVQVETRATPRSQDLSLRIDCAQLSTRIVGRAEGGSFTLTEAGSVAATLAPALLAKLSTSKDLQLSAPLPIQVTLDRLAFPVRGFDPSKVAVTARLEARGGARLGDLDLRTLTASLVSDNLAKSVAVALDGDFAEGLDATTIRANGAVSDAFNTDGQPQLDRMRLEGKIAIDGLPMSLADRLLGQDALAQALLGPRVDLNCTSSFSSSRHGTLRLDLQAPRVELGTIALELTDKLSLTRPVVLRTTVSKGLFGRFMKGDPPMELKNEVPIQIRLSRFSAPRPLRGEPAFQPDRTTLEAMLTAGPLELGHVQRLGDVTAAGATLRVGGASLSALDVRSSFEISQPDPGGALRELTGPKPLKIDVRASVGLDHQGMTATDVQLGLESQRLVGRVRAGIDEGFTTASLKEPAELRLVLVPALLDKLDLVRPGSPKLASPATMLVAVKTARLPLGDSLAGLEITGNSKLDRVTLAGDGAWSGASLHDIEMSFRFHGAEGSGTAKVESKASVPGQQEPGSLSVDAEVAGLLQEGDKASLDATVRLDGLPTAFLEALAKQGRKLAVIGPKVGIQATARLAGFRKPKGVVDARLQSQNLMVDAGLDFAETVQLSRPVQARLVLTQEGYQQLSAGDQETSSLVLHEPATIEVTIPSLRWPQAAGLPRAARVRVEAERMRFLNRRSNKVLDLAGLTATAESTNLAKDLQVKIAGRLGETGHIGVSLALADPLTTAGDLNLEGLSAGLSAELRELPVAALDGWLALDGLLLAALGKQLTVTARSTLKELDGPVEARLQANNARAALDCALRDNVIRLNKPCAIHLDATPELGRRLLSRLHPFLRGISAGTAIKVTVDNDGMMVPLGSFDIGRLVIPRTTVDLGKVTLETDVVLQALLALAKRKSPQQLDTWFTPAVFSIRNGTVKFTKRMDILFGKDFQVATWGSADLRSAAYRQTVAMTGPTLAKIFHLKNIEPEEMFRIPIRGVASAPKIDYSKATAELARLRAEDEALSKLAKQMDKLPPFLRGTVEAQVKKAARQLAGSLSGGDQSPPPPPSARPLPWK